MRIFCVFNSFSSIKPGLAPAEFQSSFQSGASPLFHPQKQSRASKPAGLPCVQTPDVGPTVAAAATPTESGTIQMSLVPGTPIRHVKQTTPNRQHDKSGKASSHAAAKSKLQQQQQSSQPSSEKQQPTSSATALPASMNALIVAKALHGQRYPMPLS